MKRKSLALIFVLAFNFWIWKIFALNIFAGTITLLTTIFLWADIEERNDKYFYLAAFFLVLLVFFQYRTSSINSLTFLNTSEKVNQQLRLRAYPPVSIKILGKTIWIPLANWFELRPETVAVYKLGDNLGENLDPNLFFFANHPRERVGVREFEKFPYILLLPFVIGLLSFKKKYTRDVVLSLSPLVLLAIIGNSNPAGPFVLFPFIAITTALGLVPIFAKKKYAIIFLIAFVLVFLQVASYGRS